MKKLMAEKHTVEMEYFECPNCGTHNDSAYNESFDDVVECWACNKPITLK